MLPAHRFRHRGEVSPVVWATPLARTQRRAKGSESAQEPVSLQSPDNWAVDIDGVVDAFPRVLGALVSALSAAGHHVYIMTGIDEDTVSDADVEAKRGYLSSLGVGPDTYHELVVLPQPHPANKAEALKANGCGVLVDNNRENIRAAVSEGVVGFYLYNTREH